MMKNLQFTIYNRKLKIQRGLSLIEILIVITIFAVLGVIVTRAVALTLQGSKKSESLVSVRENLDYSMSVIERQIRNADSIPVCPNPDPKVLSFIDQNGNTTSLSCINTGLADSYVASGSGALATRLTDDSIIISTCSLNCSLGDSSNPSYVDISIQAQSATLTGAQNSSVTTNTRIYLRNY